MGFVEGFEKVAKKDKKERHIGKRFFLGLPATAAYLAPKGKKMQAFQEGLEHAAGKNTSHALAGAGIGAGTGAITGAALARTLAKRMYGADAVKNLSMRGNLKLHGRAALLGALAGTVAGTGIGSSVGTFKGHLSREGDAIIRKYDKG